MTRHTVKLCLVYCLILILFLFVIQIYFSMNEKQVISNSMIKSQPKNKSLDYYKTSVNWSEYQVIRKENQSLILVLGESRSGTSFLADLLQQNWPTFFAYEPLFSMKLGSLNLWNKQEHSPRAFDILTKIFECDFRNLSNHFHVLWKSKERNKVIQKYLGIDNNLYWDKTINEYVCKRCDTVLIKSIRISVKQFNELQQKLNSEIKLVFNVRDPRGVISSRRSMNWCSNDVNCTSFEILCQRMREDLGYLRELHKIQPGMVSLVRSEDLSLKPYKTGKALFEKLGLEFNPAIEEWIERHTNDSTHLKDPYALQRKSKDIPFSWTKKLNWSQIKIAEETCNDVMQLLGYRQLGLNENNQDNNLLSDNFELDYLRP